jgi:Histidine kinase-, DNA gyrase B-, and HSP90-like ATPase
MFEKLKYSVLTFLSQLIGGADDSIYTLKSRLKIYLVIIGLLVVSASFIYSYFLAETLQQQEIVQMYNLRQSMELKNQNSFDSLPENVKAFIDQLGPNNNNIPIILTDDRYEIQDARNFDDIEVDTLGRPKNMALAKKKLNKLIGENRTPIYVRDIDGMIVGKVYYDDSKILTLLRYYPFFQFILISFFIGFGYLIFSAARRSEQNQVWVGMAKETAHQLGTPIAAILGWIEHLRAAHEDDDETLDVVKELENDVNRLTLVADRFSKIGSAPELIPVNIYEELDRCREYMQRRSPRKVKFVFPDINSTPQYLSVKINAHLFDWVVENLLRNSIDAMEGGEGTLSASIYEEPQWVGIDITDTGKGIPKNKFQTVFQPGFTTKKRGWGLGLSLAKRIIENYHGGKIFVKESEPNKATTISIKMPKVKNNFDTDIKKL